MIRCNRLFLVAILFFINACKVNKPAAQNQTYREEHRPQFHYTPARNWMNDPNGMVYFDGEYHLFYQHDNVEKIFTNMSWGHAISTDLVHWKEFSKAIVPDSDGLGMIFSGSAVVDKNNTAGFGVNALVAFYTSTSPKQQQSMAYSINKGRTWTKYSGNPVIKNTADDNVSDDFRDPKVIWHNESKKWIMSIAVQDHIEFWSSKNLKDWAKESEFGQGVGSHRGVWECPDLFRLPVDGNENNKKWVLLVSINPGGPNGGSATQYFVGEFDGNKFLLDKQFGGKLSTGAIVPTGKIFADFEGNNYSNWLIEGEAFGQGPANGTLGTQQKVSDFEGKGLVNTYLNGDATTGKLVSPVFTIETDYINFLIGGGDISEGTGIRLLVNNQAVRTATGNNSESLSWKSWDTQELKGKQARIEIVDNAKGGWGHILVDQIMFANAPAINKKEGKWIDYGTDNYAGVTISNVENRAIAMGWMSNWQYAGAVPTKVWRGAMTVPRELTLRTIDNSVYVASAPVKEITKIIARHASITNITINERFDLSEKLVPFNNQFQLKFNTAQLEDFAIVLSNDLGDELLIGYDKKTNEYYIDRSKAGKTNFEKGFAAKHVAPRISTGKSIEFNLFVDVTSVELFADEGLTVMTDIFFPNKAMNKVSISSGNGIKIRELSYSKIDRIWK